MLVWAAVVRPWFVAGKTATQPAPQLSEVEEQLAHAAFALLQVAELAPPLVPWQTQVRVVLQAVWPLSEMAVPVEQPSATELLHTPFWGAGMAVQLPEGALKLPLVHSDVAVLPAV